jgi:hypothetical protein
MTFTRFTHAVLLISSIMGSSTLVHQTNTRARSSLTIIQIYSNNPNPKTKHKFGIVAFTNVQQNSVTTRTLQLVLSTENVPLLRKQFQCKEKKIKVCDIMARTPELNNCNEILNFKQLSTV